MTCLTVLICSYLCKTISETNFGALSMSLSILYWSCIISMFELLAMTHSNRPYARIHLKTILQIKVLLDIEKEECLPISQYRQVEFFFASMCFLYLSFLSKQIPKYSSSSAWMICSPFSDTVINQLDVILQEFWSGAWVFIRSYGCHRMLMC